MIRRLAAIAAVVVVAHAAEAQTAQITDERETVKTGRVHLRGLDTLNGTSRDIDLDVGATGRFGHLEIVADTCRVPRADPDGDAYAFLRIRDIRESDPRFSGWMFASSPALSALDHPRYDVWVLSCNSR